MLLLGDLDSVIGLHMFFFFFKEEDGCSLIRGPMMVCLEQVWLLTSDMGSRLPLLWVALYSSSYFILLYSLQ